MKQMSQSKYRAEFAQTLQQMASVRELRKRCFGDAVNDADTDQFDDACAHVMIYDIQTNLLVCCFRFMHLPNASKIHTSYSAQFYDLSNLSSMSGSLVELGRFCVDPDTNDPNILRTAWSVLTKFVDSNRVEFLFGCSSFQGTDDSPYEHAFALLRDRHLAPEHRAPQIKAPKIFQYAEQLSQHQPDIRLANLSLPPLLRTYLTMGGWVSDHAVIDDQLDTIHVFTGLEIHAIPESRKRLLRAIA